MDALYKYACSMQKEAGFKDVFKGVVNKGKAGANKIVANAKNTANNVLNYGRSKVTQAQQAFAPAQDISKLYNASPTINAGLGIGGLGDQEYAARLAAANKKNPLIRKGIVPADMLKDPAAVKALEERGFTLIGR